MQYQKRISNWLINLLVPITKWLGELHIPFTRKKVNGNDFMQISQLIKPGMVILTKTYGELTNLLIPGVWSHAGIYVGDGKIVEAIGSGVVEKDLAEFLLTKDKVCLLEPYFVENQFQMDNAARFARSKVGFPYDYKFKSNNKAFYCSELVFASYHHATGGLSPFELRETLGIETAIPDDIYNASKKWRKLYENEVK